MTGRDDIDSAVKRFVLERIKSIEHLEILLLLAGQPKREWTAHDVSQKLRNSETSAESWLQDLNTQNILKARKENNRAIYSYDPQETVFSDVITKLAKTFTERRVSIYNLIFSKPLEKIQVFADAFQIRRKDEKDDG